MVFALDIYKFRSECGRTEEDFRFFTLKVLALITQLSLGNFCLESGSWGAGTIAEMNS